MFIGMRMCGVRCNAHSLEGQRHEAETTTMFAHFCNFSNDASKAAQGHKVCLQLVMSLRIR